MLPEEFKLPSGLRVLLLPDRSESVTVLGLVKTGSRYEKEEQEGIAHFYEHMVFKGTKKFPFKKDLALAVDKIGAECNGATGQEYTYYFVKTAKKDLLIGLDLICQLLTEPLLSKNEIPAERGVILEELNMYNDVPQYRSQIELAKLLFPNHPLGKSGVGQKKTINSLVQKDFVDFKNNFYSSEKTVLVIAGGIGKTEEIKEELKRQFFGLKKANEIMAIPFKAADTFKKNKVKKIFKKTDQAHLAIGTRALSRNDKRHYAQGLLNIILGGGMSSRLFQEIREKRGLCYSVNSSVETFEEVGAFEVTAGLNKKRLNEAIEAIKDQLFLLAKKAVDKEELSKAKHFFEGKLALSLEDSYQKAHFYGKQALLEPAVKDINQLLKEVNNVESKDILLVAKEIFLTDKIQLVLVE